jgi:hypothetical protein
MCRLSCNSCRSDGIRAPTDKDRPLTPHVIVSVVRGTDVANIRSLTDLFCLRETVETHNASKGPLQYIRCLRCGHTHRNFGYALWFVAFGDVHPSGKCVIPNKQLKFCSCRGNHTANNLGCGKWKEGKAATAKRAQEERCRNDGPYMHLQVHKSAPPKQEKVATGWNHVFRGGRVVKA